MSKLTDVINDIGLRRLADRLGVTYQAVRKWERGIVPAERVLPICRAAGGVVTPYELRPDIYPDPAWLPAIESQQGEQEAA